MALQDYRADALRCTRCSYCKWIPFDLVKSHRFAKGCPSIEYNNFHSYSAGGRLVTALSLLEGRCEVTEHVIDSVFKCQLCGSCDVTCKVCRFDMEPLLALRELRVKLAEQGHVTNRHSSLMKGYRSLNNMLGKPKAKRGDWAQGIAVKDLTKEKAPVVFHAGCQYSYYSDLWQAAKTSIEILTNSGVDFGIMGSSENCCGGRAYHIGYPKDCSSAAERNLQAWTDAGAKTVITPCADCYHTFKRIYAELGHSIEVLHIVEFVDRLINEGKLTFKRSIPLRVTYHDPCHLGRQGEPHVPWKGKEKKIFGQVVVYDPPRPRYNGAKGVYEPPRNILRAIEGIQLVEMERNREAAWCCGAGGGVREAYPDYSLSTARHRLEEAACTGADALVTACPWCERNFIEATGEKDTKIKILDIMQLIQQAI